MEVYLRAVFVCQMCIFASARMIILPRIKRGNTFDPAWPAFPTQNQPLWQPIPYPIPTSTMAPVDALMPKPPKSSGDNNPFLDSLNDPINPNFGLGFVALQPTIMGGNLNVPVFNMLRPQESVSGTFGFARPMHVRYGMQGGPYYPWQDKAYTRTAKELASIENQQMLLRDSTDHAQNWLPPMPSGQSNQNSNVPPFRPFNPVLPPQMPVFSS